MGVFSGKEKKDKNKICLTADFNQSVEKIFGLVLDVENYPAFIDEVESASKSLLGANEMETEIVLSDKAIATATEKLKEKIREYKIPVPGAVIRKMIPKSQKVNITWNEFDRISVRNIGGVGDNVVSTWHFTLAANGGGTHIEYETDYSNASWMVRKLLNLDTVQTFFKDRGAETMEAVKKEAEKIFKQANGGPKAP